MKPFAMPCKSLFFTAILLTMISFKGIAQEICNNGIDDDGDGLVDLFDPDCQCRFTVSGNLLQNGSFEESLHCPATYTYDSEYNIALHWKFGSYTNVNEANFYHNLNCPSDAAQVMGHMPPALPLPQGTGFVAIYNDAYIDPIPENKMMKGYITQCLTTPLTKGEDYTLSFDAGRFKSWDNLNGKIFPFKVAVFGNADCNAVPFGKKYVQGNGCPADYAGWIFLGETTMYSNGQWEQGKIHLAVPSDINVIAIGPDCSVLPPINDLTDSTTFLDYHLYYLDELQLLPTKNFPFEYIHVQAGNDCNSLPVLEAPASGNATYQWYKDSIAIKGATNATFQVTDTTAHYYNVFMTTSDKCITSEPLMVARSQLNKIKIPADTALCSNDTLQLAGVLDGIQYTINGMATNNVSVSKAGDYTIIATDLNGCQRIFNTHIAQQNCTDCAAYIPTAFTPNGDGLNDIFKVQLPCFTPYFHATIFNRWGKLLFQSTDIHQGWDGTYNGQKMSPGAYVYIIQYKTALGTPKIAKGIVMLIE